MDKITKYRLLLEEYLTKRASIQLFGSPGAKPHIVIDREKDEYCLLWVGWTGSRYKHSLMFHFQIVDGKVWIHENRTDIDLVKHFVERGIAEPDIVLGFVPSYLMEKAVVTAG